MKRTMWWAVGTVAALAILSTNRQDRMNARRQLDRWNPLFLALFAVGLIGVLLVIFGP